ncbi:MAG: hypothetical protein SGCHY_000488 [Lobulomycetales sp.]
MNGLIRDIQCERPKNINLLVDGVAQMLRQDQENHISPFLDSYFTLDLGQSLLVAEYVSLVNSLPNPVQQLKPFCITENAVAAATQYVKRKYPRVTPPRVIINCENEQCETLYVKIHLTRILYEVIKTSMTQTIEHAQATGDHKHATSTLPPVRIWISDGQEDVSFKIDAEDGGIPISSMPKVWSYTQPHFTPMVNPPSPLYPFKEYCIPSTFSLPFSRTLARYFGGDLEIAPADGYGTDFYLHLTSDVRVPENLPKDSSSSSTAGTRQLSSDPSWLFQLNWPGIQK